MSIKINQEKCIGCDRCVVGCPGSLIKRSSDERDHKVDIKFPKNCWGCTACIKACPVGAIEFYLGADVGGNGTTLRVESKQDILDWIMTRDDGAETHIEINTQDANNY
jgi:adenylylsulfate reductase subunit B